MHNRLVPLALAFGIVMGLAVLTALWQGETEVAGGLLVFGGILLRPLRQQGTDRKDTTSG